jgi:hypothetical protein
VRKERTPASILLRSCLILRLRGFNQFEIRPSYEGLHHLVSYAATRLQEEALEDPTWDTLGCSINQSDAMFWLAEHRPEIAATISD